MIVFSKGIGITVFLEIEQKKEFSNNLAYICNNDDSISRHEHADRRRWETRSAADVMSWSAALDHMIETGASDHLRRRRQLSFLERAFVGMGFFGANFAEAALVDNRFWFLNSYEEGFAKVLVVLQTPGFGVARGGAHLAHALIAEAHPNTIVVMNLNQDKNKVNNFIIIIFVFKLAKHKV